MSLSRDQILDLANTDRWFRYWMPYAFARLDHPKVKHVWLPLNRNYKPLGITAGDHVDYADFIDQAIVFARDPRATKGVFYPSKDPDPDMLWMYASTIGREDYFARLEKLSGLKQKLFGKLRGIEGE